MDERTVVRFRTRAIVIHWLHAASFAVMLTTGALMFFDLVSQSGGHLIRVIHQAGAVFFVLGPVAFLFWDPRGTVAFLQQTWRWGRDDLAWLRKSVGHYFGRRASMPAQGFLNGDQKLWQLTVVVTGCVLTLSGILLWFFRLKLPLLAYQWVRLLHGAAFVAVAVLFPVHFYLTTLHPKFGESLASMLDGKVSPPYARDHYQKWYADESRTRPARTSVAAAGGVAREDGPRDV